MPTCAHALAIEHADPFTAVRPGQRHEAYRALAQTGPVHRIALPTGERAWLVTGYREVRAALTDPRLAKSASPATARAQELVPTSRRR
jgi:cytochrome P450